MLAQQAMAEDSGGGLGSSASTTSLRGTPPPPPRIQLPDPAEGPSREPLDRRRRSTVQGVTSEARRVLEQLLKRSLSQNDASPYQRAHIISQDMHVIEECPPEANSSVLRSESYQRAAADDAVDGRVDEDPGYVYTHQLQPEKTGSLSSEESEEEEEDHQGEGSEHAVTPRRTHRRRGRSSSSSTEDYEYVDNELLTRRKKSFFRRATERLRQNFRRKKQRAGLESPKLGLPPAPPAPHDKPGKKKSKGFGLSLKRNASEKSKSSSTPNEVVGDAKIGTRNSARTSSGENGSVVVMAAAGGGDDTDALTDDKKRKSPLPWKSWRKEGSGEERDTRGVFENILRQIRKGSMRLRRKGSKEHQRSKSADYLIVRPVSKQDEEYVRRFVTPHAVSTPHQGYDSDRTDTRTASSDRPLPPSPLVPAERRPGRHSLREKMSLDGLIAYRPGRPPLPPSGDAADQRRTDSDIYDETDTGLSASLQQLVATIDKPFHERTATEKEELYEKIAKQLSNIADQYEICEQPTSLHAPKTLASPAKGSPAGTPPGDQQVHKRRIRSSLLEKQLGSLLRERGDLANKNLSADAMPIIADLVRNASYSKFKQIVNENIGSEPGWQQIAMMFRLTQTSVQLAGMGTAAAVQIKDMTLKYFEDKFASWIIGQGGWESMVEDTNTEIDSELD